MYIDEATSALDTINEERITKYIKSQRCTQIIVAHRLSTIKDADIIFVMKGGKIVESGNHKYFNSSLIRDDDWNSVCNFFRFSS